MNKSKVIRFYGPRCKRNLHMTKR